MGIFKRKNKLKLEYNADQLIVIRSHKSELTEIFGIVFLIAGIFAMVYFSKWEDKMLVFAIFAIVSIPMLFLLYKTIKRFISKDYLVFDRFSQSILQNERIIAAFPEVDHVEVRTFIASDKEENNYLLNLRLTSKSSIEINNKLDQPEIKKVAEAIGIFLNKEVKTK